MKDWLSFISIDIIGLMVLFFLFFLMSLLVPFSISHEPIIYVIYIFWIPCALFVWHHPNAPRKPIKWLALAALSIFSDVECMRKYLKDNYGNIGYNIVDIFSPYSFIGGVRDISEDTPIEHTVENSAEGGGKILVLKGAKNLGNIITKGAGGSLQPNGTVIPSKAVMGLGKFISKGAALLTETADVVGITLPLWSQIVNEVAYQHCTCEKK